LEIRWAAGRPSISFLEYPDQHFTGAKKVGRKAQKWVSMETQAQERQGNTLTAHAHMTQILTELAEPLPHK
jgi:hypothetical protein